MDIISTTIIAFFVGGVLCSIAQVLIIRTRLTAARILVIFLVAGIFLEAFGVFGYLKDFTGGGVTIPIVGFGATLSKGAIEGVRASGLLGAFSGGLTATAAGIVVAVVASFIVSLFAKAKVK